MKRMYARFVLWLIRPALEAHRAEREPDIAALTEKLSRTLRASEPVSRAR
ncbi:Uncharacterised protein [Burkholderia pseudomallei]|nr:Uncharacterised protein [Burkholderia pseudomallei]CAJ4630121.1 Uncharacterised protein [Burkholderia pseudomallei]CAJ4794656.1 Uncharacterised protein [Burkholderia pseudomallei]CAJ5322572.1 Uncharacterised protein [Burkholderia pseudomallei]CAJ5996459.1 Uncharacterised protein [Burkholderia pseudomallei]